MWSFRQDTGRFYDPNGLFIVAGWSGHGEGLNNPSMQNVPFIGPLPKGYYTIGAPVDNSPLGPCALPLIPDSGNQMFNRSEFYIHGAAFVHPENSSDGCIILPRAVRERLAGSSDKRLVVE